MTSGFLKGRGLAPLWVALSALGLSGAALAADAPAEAEKCRVHSVELPVRVVGSRPLVTVKLNGQSVPMLLDSGAFYSFLSEVSAKQLDLPLRRAPGDLTVTGFTGDIEELQATRVKSVELGGERIPDVDFLVGGNDLDTGIMGILGRNILSIADTEYDLAHGMVRLMFPTKPCKEKSMAYWAGDAPVIEVPLLHRGARGIMVATKVNGKKVDAVLDTGAPSTSLTIATARRAGIEESDMKILGRVGGAGSKHARVWTTMVGQFELGGEKVTNNRFSVAEVSTREWGILIGLDYFLWHRIYVARSQDKVYVTWNGGAVFAQSEVEGETGHYDQRYAAKAETLADDDAEGLYRRGNAWLVRGQATRALEDLDRAVRLQPTAANFEARARAKAALKQPREALTDLDESLRLDPTSTGARLFRVPLRMAVGDRAGAGADLAQLDAQLAPIANHRRDLATLYARRGESALAIRQYDLWIASHAQDAKVAAARGARCWMRMRMNAELDKAIEDCREAADMDKGDPQSRSNLGWTYLRTGDLPQSLKAFDASIKLMSMPIALYGRGLARLRSGDTARGQADIEAARREKPGIDGEVRRQGLDVAPDAPPDAPGGDAFAETEDL